MDVVIDARNDARQDAWQRAAFIGWQNYCLQPRGEDAPPRMPLGEWLEMFGLSDGDDIDGRTEEEFADDVADLMAKFGLQFRGMGTVETDNEEVKRVAMRFRADIPDLDLALAAG